MSRIRKGKRERGRYGWSIIQEERVQRVVEACDSQLKTLQLLGGHDYIRHFCVYNTNFSYFTL